MKRSIPYSIYVVGKTLHVILQHKNECRPIIV